MERCPSCGHSAKATRLAALEEVREMVLFMSNNYLDPKRVDTLTYVLRQIDAMIAKEVRP